MGNQIMQQAPFQTIEATAKATGASQYLVRKMCRDGTAPCIRSGSKYLVNVPLFMEVLDKMSLGEGVG